MTPISRGFRGRRPADGLAARLPPGQYETRDFPVLSAGPTPHTPLSAWDLTLRGPGGKSARWMWHEFATLPRETITVDIHCVTKWSKFDTKWEGVSIDTLISHAAAKQVTTAGYVLASCDGGYTTNLPLPDLTNGKAWIAFSYGGEPLAPEHGGAGRPLLSPPYFLEKGKRGGGVGFLGTHSPGFLGAPRDYKPRGPWGG